MAGDWMKIEKVTPDKPEIDAMADLLGLDPDSVFGKCFRVWRWFDDHTTDGNAGCVTSSLQNSQSGNAMTVTKKTVDRKAGLDGFADAMQAVGWLVELDGAIQLPKFDRHNGETSKTRALTAKRVAKTRGKSNATCNGDVTDDVTQSALPREEKRRCNTPLPPKGGIEPIDEFNQGRRPRDRYKKIGAGERNDLKSIQRWVASHSEDLIPRDQFTFSKIFEAAAGPMPELEFYRAVERFARGECS